MKIVVNEDNIRKVTADFTKNFNKLCDEKANSKTLKLQITEEETRLFYLFVNYKNYTEEQIANVFGKITNPSEVARKITNFVTQVTKYEGLTNEKVDINSLLINNNSKKEYENFKELIEKDEVRKAFNKYSSNNATYLDYINANNYSKLNKAEKESLASIYGASLERFKEFVINVNYLARINNLVNNNKVFSKYLHTGVSVPEYTKEGVRYHTVKLIDFENIDNNEFLVSNQFTIIEHSEKRPDVIIFINGLPLIVFELKSMTREEVDLLINVLKNSKNIWEEIL